jgi:hypothetical protein
MNVAPVDQKMPSVDALPETPGEGAPDGEPIYVLGRTDAETRRLMLQAVTDRVRPGGVVAFAEADFTSVLGYVQAGPSALIRSAWSWAVEAFRQAGVHTAMAPKLYHAFVAAGLGEPRMFLHAPLGCHEEWPGYEWAAESMRSLLPLMEQFGIVTPRELGVETLTERFRDDVVRTHFPFMTIPMVAALARKPAE